MIWQNNLLQIQMNLAASNLKFPKKKKKKTLFIFTLALVFFFSMLFWILQDTEYLVNPQIRIQVLFVTEF